MCGIVVVIRKDGLPAYKNVLKRYRKQKHRGTQGYGYVAVKDNLVVSYQRATTEHEIEKLLEQETAPEIWFHHRNPTSTPNVEEEAHPLLIDWANLEHKYFVLHNGVIHNDDDLKKQHDAMGIEYKTLLTEAFIVGKKVYRHLKTNFNDTEALAVETALALDGKKKKIETEGSAAVVGLQVKEGVVVSRFFFRNSNPLNFHEDKQMITLTSEGGGVTVNDKYVMRLKVEGGTTLFGSKDVTIESPRAYKSWENKSALRGVYNEITNEWDLIPAPTPLLPVVQAGYNFPRRVSDFPLTPERTDTRLAEILEEVAKLTSSHAVHGKNLKYLPLDRLWEEFDKWVDLEKELRDITDESVLEWDDAPLYVQEMERAWNQLQKLTEYTRKLSSSIHEREAWSTKQ